MPPPTLLIALILAFGLSAGTIGAPPVNGWEGMIRGVAALGLPVLVALLVAAAGRLVSLSSRAHPDRLGVLGRAYLTHASLGAEVALLGVFAWTIHGLNWPATVAWLTGRIGVVVPLLNETLVLAPYVIGLGLIWWGLYLGERAVCPPRWRPRRLESVRAYLIAKARRSLAIVLPLVAAIALMQQLFERLLPEGFQGGSVHLAAMGLVGLGSLTALPLLVKRMWPYHPLEPGPLRSRLLDLARRRRVRISEIHVWQTDHTLATAAVTGFGFGPRYVFLTDALLEHLDDERIVAVFGHELSHLHRRHIRWFGVALLGAVGLASLVNWLIDRSGGLDVASLFWGEAVRQAPAALVLGGVVFFVFGAMSRSFERQADLDGARALSQTRSAADSTDSAHAPPLAGPDDPPDRYGLEVFIATLRQVAAINHLSVRRWTWRHGRMADRIAFLERVRDHPETELIFLRRLRRRGRWIAAVTTFTTLMAWLTGSFDLLR